MISVVIVTLGERLNDLVNCLDAFTYQTIKDFEIVIVLPKEISEYSMYLSLRQRDTLNIRIINQDSKGICNARNCGIKASKGEIIAFTDDDAEPYPDWIEKINQRFEEYPDLDYLGGEFTLETKTVWQRWIDHNYHLSEIDIGRGLCHGFNMAYRRNVFDNHLFDENIVYGADEAEFQMRLNASGLKCNTFPDILIHHEHRNNFFSFTKMRWAYSQGHVYIYEEKLGQSLFHWDDIMNVGLFISLFYALQLSLLNPIFFIYPLINLILIFAHEYRSTYTLGTLLVQIYSTILWTISKMYYSFHYHLRRWGILTPHHLYNILSDLGRR